MHLEINEQNDIEICSYNRNLIQSDA